MALHPLVPQTTFSATVKRRVFTSGRRGWRGLLTVLRRRTSIKRHRGSQPPVVKTSITLSSVPLVNKFANSIPQSTGVSSASTHNVTAQRRATWDFWMPCQTSRLRNITTRPSNGSISTLGFWLWKNNFLMQNQAENAGIARVHPRSLTVWPSKVTRLQKERSVNQPPFFRSYVKPWGVYLYTNM